VTGDEVRNVKFSSGGMYDARQVNDLLERIAAELDAGRPARPLVENAAFRKRIFGRGYDTGAVDWFLEQLRRQEDPPEEACGNADPWRDLDAEPYYVHREPGRAAGRVAGPLPRDCADAWRDFGQQPGTPLSWVRTGARSRELRTADQRPIASFRYRAAAFFQGSPSFYGNHTLSVGGRTFTLKKVTRSAWPGIAETIGRYQPGAPAHFPRGQTGGRDSLLRQLLDETGIPVLYRGGQHFDHSAGSYIKFPGQRWLRFPVRCTARSNAIMTAVDQAGNKVVRYRFAGSRKTMEIAIHPDQRLTEELTLAIAVSAPWVADFFRRPSGGG
jgi:DivIVA domain-containing protein